MAAAPHLNRPAWAVLLIALLGLRLLAPAGFMPAFDQGAVTIVPCPDGAAEAPMPHHSNHHPAKLHQLCPYAAAATPAAVGPAIALLLGAIVFLSAPLIGRPLFLVASARAREPPRLRGPPIPA
jgi:hypothetical protein